MKLYNNPICPFAQRAKIALLEAKLDFEEIKVPLIGELQKAELFGIQTLTQYSNSTLEEIKKWKQEYKDTINPSGEVPVLKHGENFIFESDVVADYITRQFSPQINVVDHYQHAKMRMACKSIDQFLPTIYGFLMNQDPSKDQEFVDKIENFFKNFTKKISSTFYLENDLFSLVEIHISPFIYRFNILFQHYRDYNLFGNQDWQIKLQQFQNAIEQRESFQKSVIGKDLVIQSYEFYANNNKVENGKLAGRGQSKFGK